MWLLDLTYPEVGKHTLTLAVEEWLRSVIGTTGIYRRELGHVNRECKEKAVGAIIAPNFASVRSYDEILTNGSENFQDVEVIELHQIKN